MFRNILEHASDQKGLQMIGIIDCHAPEVLVEIETLIQQGSVAESMARCRRIECKDIFTSYLFFYILDVKISLLLNGG